MTQVIPGKQVQGSATLTEGIMTQVMPGKQVQGSASVHTNTMLVAWAEILLGIAAWVGGT